VHGTHDQTDIFAVLNGFKPSKLNGGDVAPGHRRHHGGPR
jgi:hypothetical protein